MSLEKNRRKNYFIKKEFQTKFILRFCFLVILGAIITGTILYLLSKDTVTTAFVNSRLSIVTTADYILPVLISASMVSIILISLATTFVIMFLSHRIAGPLFKIEKSVKEVGDGNLNLKITLRSTDEIVEMANSLNEMIENFRNHVLEVKNQASNLCGQIDNLTTLLKNNQSLPPQIQNGLRDLCAKKEQLEKAINYFKL